MIKFILGFIVALAILNPETTKLWAGKTVDAVSDVAGYVSEKASDSE